MSSTVREIPDHQELYLSRTTLSSMILELNHRVNTSDALFTMSHSQSKPHHHHHQAESAPAPAGGASASPETIDKAAALYHLHDLCDDGDTLETIVPAQKVKMGKFNDSVAAYKGAVVYTSPKRGADVGRIPVDVEGTAAGAAGKEAAATSRLTCHYLLVRLVQKETDLVVFFNVPHEEFDGAGDPRGLSREEELGSEVVERMVQSLEVRDWSLFG